ncbi:MAG: hypothetical protein KDB57_07175 [Solirubrobacterales bacterium]|nr:hypothetical protein [Solirubrobacterales bacterium]
MASFNLPGRSTKAPAPEEKPKTVLEQRRDELRTTFTEMQWDLGGAAYEMAARDYFRLDVLAKMAARLQVVDAELAEIERITRLQEAGAAGACAGCGSLHARGAIYCWRCGRNVAQPQGSAMVLPAGTTTPPPRNGNGSPNGSRPEAPAERTPVFSDTSVIDHDHRPVTPGPTSRPEPMAGHLPTEPPVHAHEPGEVTESANGNGSSHFFEPHAQAPLEDLVDPEPATFEDDGPEPEDLDQPEDMNSFEGMIRPDEPDFPGDQPAR